MTTDKPVYLPDWQIPVQLQSEVRKCLDNWLKQGIIHLSKSPYASQVVIVCKKTSKICLWIDFRRLNAISIRDSFPLPRVEEALQAVQAAVWFSSFNLAQGYLQMAMEEADILKTAFHTGSSCLYEFMCMPFRLTNTGASFCRLMEMCIWDQQYVTLLFYLDDICIFAETADQMLDHIEHILSANGVSPNPEKVAKIKDWPIPKTPKEVHSFVGLASYYRCFIPNSAKWAGPLHTLIIPASFKQKIRKGEMKKSNLPEFQWTPSCQEGFDQLKKALMEAPVLAYPDYSKPFILETDASLKGLGDEDEWIAVSYKVEDQGGRISSTGFNQAISELVGGTKIDKKLKDRMHVMDIAKEKLDGETIEVATGVVSLFDRIPSKEMAKYQRQDNQISPAIKYIEEDTKPPKKFTYQIRSKLACKLALQWDRLILKQGILHRLYIFNEIEYHQLVLPQRYHRKVLTALHDHMGHQSIDRTLDLL